MKRVTIIVLLCLVLLGSTASASTNGIRNAIRKQDPCLAWLVDHEDGTWEPTRYGGGSYWHSGEHFDTRRSYGLPQAQPGSKMASAGPDWRTNPWTQLRWMRGYVNGRYHGSCKAKAFWLTHHWY